MPSLYNEIATCISQGVFVDGLISCLISWLAQGHIKQKYKQVKLKDQKIQNIREIQLQVHSP